MMRTSPTFGSCCSPRKWLVGVVLSVLVLNACVAPIQVASQGQPTAAAADTGCASATAPAPAAQATVTHATGFTIEYVGNAKVVTVLKPYRDAQEVFKYVLVPCGTAAPEGYADALVIETPIRSIVAMSSRYLPFLSRLGVLDTLAGVDSVAGIYDPAVLKLAEEKGLAEVGFGAEVAVEQVISVEPDLVMTYAAVQSQANAHPVLQQAGLPVVINAEYMEETPLGRAEWIKFVAAFYNKEAEATAYFDGVVAAYEALAAQAETADDAPRVLWGVPGKDTWFMPGGRSFVARLIADARGTFLWNDDESAGNMPLAFEAVYERGADADVWLIADGYPSLGEMLAADARLGQFQAVERESVWSNDARINDNFGNDYWESGVTDPQLILQDLVQILHPGLLPEQPFNFWRQLD